MLDLSNETIISIGQAARLIPGRGGRPMNFSTVWRWIMKGAKGPDGLTGNLRIPCGLKMDHFERGRSGIPRAINPPAGR